MGSLLTPGFIQRFWRDVAFFIVMPVYALVSLGSKLHTTVFFCVFYELVRAGFFFFLLR